MALWVHQTLKSSVIGKFSTWKIEPLFLYLSHELIYSKISEPNAIYNFYFLFTRNYNTWHAWHFSKPLTGFGTSLIISEQLLPKCPLREVACSIHQTVVFLVQQLLSQEGRLPHSDALRDILPTRRQVCSSASSK